MKIKILNILVVFFLFISCKKNGDYKIKNKKQIASKEHKIKLRKVQQIEQEKLIKISIDKIDSITSNQNLLEISTKYRKKDTTCWIEGAEFKNNKEKVIYYGSYYDKDNISSDANYTFLIDKKGFLSFLLQELSVETSNDIKNIKKDTFFFKNNKIYFWKNKQVTKEELLKKEKEILAIKKEIDSVMEW